MFSYAKSNGNQKCMHSYARSNGNEKNNMLSYAKSNGNEKCMLSCAKSNSNKKSMHSQSWALGTLKVTTISVPILCQRSTVGTDNGTFLKSNDDVVTRYRFSVLEKRKFFLKNKFWFWFSSCKATKLKSYQAFCRIWC